MKSLVVFQHGFVLQTAVLLALLLCPCRQVYAQHPIDVQQLEARGEYRAALRAYDRLPQRIRNRDASVAAARSAWALGLVQRARLEFQKVEKQFADQTEQRAIILLSLGALELQEDNASLAALYAQRCRELPRQSVRLRGRAELLWGQALVRQDALGKALPHFTEALKLLPPQEQADAFFERGKLLLRLGQPEEARKDLERVPLEYEQTPEAIRLLAVSSIETKDSARAWYWLKKGRELFPDKFLDSWVDYSLAQVAMAKQDAALLESVLVEASRRYPPSDSWLTLLQSSAEAYTWGRLRQASEGSGSIR